MMVFPSLELVIALAAIFVLLVYHVLFYRRFRRKPLSTSLGLAHHLRGLWVQT